MASQRKDRAKIEKNEDKLTLLNFITPYFPVL